MKSQFNTIDIVVNTEANGLKATGIKAEAAKRLAINSSSQSNVFTNCPNMRQDPSHRAQLLAIKTILPFLAQTQDSFKVVSAQFI